MKWEKYDGSKWDINWKSTLFCTTPLTFSCTNLQHQQAVPYTIHSPSPEQTNKPLTKHKIASLSPISYDLQPLYELEHKLQCELLSPSLYFIRPFCYKKMSKYSHWMKCSWPTREYASPSSHSTTFITLHLVKFTHRFFTNFPCIFESQLWNDQFLY